MSKSLQSRPVLVIALLVALAAIVALAGAPTLPQYYVSLGAGESSRLGFRTVLQFFNESTQPGQGTVQLHTTDGVTIDDQLVVDWIGSEGKWAASNNEVTFTVPAGASMLLTLSPESRTYIGWARVSGDPMVVSQGRLQIAEYMGRQGHGRDEFLHNFSHEAELISTQGNRHFVFPVWLFTGYKYANTAFSLANLSAAVSDVTLTLRPDNKVQVSLQPGEMLSSYFDRFFIFAVPAIFPFELNGMVEVESRAPLGVTVLHTLGGLPLSGIATVAAGEPTTCMPTQFKEEFQLEVSGCADFGSGEPTIEFWNILEDSRCPDGAVCVWEGRARIELRVTVDGRIEPLALSTTPGEDSAKIGPYTIEFLGIEPTSKPEGVLSIDKYRGKFMVSKEQP